MVARGPGDVGCAHCTKIGATVTCQVCTHLVCEACGADWTTCSEPAGREIRLGLSARVLEVDPHGRRAIVRHWSKRPRLFDLRELRWGGELKLSRDETHFFGPHLTSDGFIVHAEVEHSDQSLVLSGVRWRKLDGSLELTASDSRPQRCSFMTSSNELAYVDGAEKVVVMTPQVVGTPVAANAIMPRAFTGQDLVVTKRTFDPMPRMVIHALHVTNNILVTGTWRELAISRMIDDELERLSPVDTGIDGNVNWVALAGNTLAYAAGGRVRARRVDARYRATEVVFDERGKFKCAALSVDGRYLAIGFGDKLLVYDVERDTQTVFDDHTDAVSFIRFTTNDHMLVSADDDNRVILRPRTEVGYVRTLIAVRPQD